VGTTPEQRLRQLLEQAAVVLEERDEGVLSSRLIWPGGLGGEACAAFLRSLDEGLAVLDPAGRVTVRRDRPSHLELLARSGAGVGVNVANVNRVARLAG
jgi:hypothetical protein